MFNWFENLVNPFPEQAIKAAPKKFWAFAWECTQGLRPYILAMTLLTGAIGAFEALLFAMMGKVVDWLSKIPQGQLWTQEKIHLLLLAGVLLFSTVFIALQTLFKHQTLAGNFPCACAGIFIS